jgi:hypothetical protein
VTSTNKRWFRGTTDTIPRSVTFCICFFPPNSIEKSDPLFFNHFPSDRMTKVNPPNVSSLTSISKDWTWKL